MRSRDNTIIATLNVRTLSQLCTHEIENYNWHILGMCETRWTYSGEVKTGEGHKFCYSGGDDRHANGVDFLVHTSIRSAVLGCQPISSRIITICLREKPLNITIIQVYDPQRITTMDKLNSSTTRYDSH